MPEDGRFTWVAPGGSGDKSLPADFLPSAIEPLRDHRIFAVVGPKAPGGFRFTRILGASRVFSGLRAKLEDVRALPAEEARAWYEAVGRALSS
jgi:hypothetical protein